MSQQAQPTNVLPASLVLMALATGGLLLMEQPFKSGRHIEPGTNAPLVAPSDQFVDARLWQDPLLPIQADWQRLLSSVDKSELDRSRYALISALTASEYAPESAHKVGYFIAPRAGALICTEI